MSTTPPSTPPPTAVQRPHLPLVLGVIGLVTLGAFENRAVGTALPTMVREFDALGSFGLANAAPNASYLISLAIAGLWSDRRGPIPTLRVGAIAFALAQLLVGTATAMPMVVAGRLLSGFAEGLLDVSLMVLVARALPAVLRPRMFSLFAAMWILPSVLGPVLTGVVTEQFGWRWVFLGAVVLLVPSWMLLGPAMRQSLNTPAPERSAEDAAELEAWRAALPWAFAASVALFSMTLAGDQLEAHRVIAGIAIPGGGGDARAGRRTGDAEGDFRGAARLPGRGRGSRARWCGVRWRGRVPAAVADAAASLQPVAGRRDAVDHRRELGVRVLAAGPGPRHRRGSTYCGPGSR